MTGKEEFCKMARVFIVDEEEGRKGYNKMINAVDTWKDEEPNNTIVGAIVAEVTRIRNQETDHAVFLAKVIDGYCEGST